MISILEQIFTQWFQSIYDNHDQNINMGEKWMQMKDDELLTLQQQADRFEMEIERQAIEIEQWLQKKQPKEFNLLIYNEEE